MDTFTPDNANNINNDCNFIAFMPISVDLSGSKLCASLTYALWQLGNKILLFETGNFLNLSSRFLKVESQGRLELVLNGNVLINQGIVNAYDSVNGYNLDCLFPDFASFDWSSYESEIKQLFTDIKIISKNSYNHVIANISVNNVNIDFMIAFHSIILLAKADEIGIRYLNKEIIRVVTINPNISVNIILIVENNKEYFYHWEVLKDSIKNHMNKNIFLVGIIQTTASDTWPLSPSNQNTITTIAQKLHNIS